MLARLLPLLCAAAASPAPDTGKAAGLAVLDWAVIGLYAAVMLALGWHFSRRNRTAEEYLLGGRKLKPFGVGLSLFATLVSAISYLTWPGETIKNGPVMILGDLAAFPIVALVVGWGIIPLIMRLRVTSAYEILEARLGLGVRLFGSGMFLALRLMWMAVIIFATSDKVLVPLAGLDESATPWFCLAMGLVTLAYTWMGGFRAVVVTDAVQALILLAGAAVSLGFITWQLGGVEAWWPRTWPAHWPAPVWGFDLVRRSFLGGALATVVWHVSTSGSDQMAIQRYLATRDVRAARTVLVISLAANALVIVLLICVGMGLLAWFHVNPHDSAGLPDADTFFPRFIVGGLPPGLSGLVVAGLLAAAMSSLSSGINSTASVVTVDLLERLGRPSRDRGATARRAALVIGLAVVAGSTLVGGVEGNLLEVAFKVVNLLVVPLFGLFFMALFVRWATGAGAIIGAAAGVATVVVINYYQQIFGVPGVGFLWAMPLGLAVQIAVGSTASLVPVSRTRPSCATAARPPA